MVRNMKKARLRLTTQYCVECKSRKPMKKFDVGRGLCAECRTHAHPQSPSRPQARDESHPQGRKSWKCPNCLKQIRVDAMQDALVRHTNSRQERCAGSGYQLPQLSTDALDYRVGGNFEGGRR